MAFVEFQGVTKVYRQGEIETYALNGASFTIEKGEFVVIVGASGAGKTTILNILGGMDSCTEAVSYTHLDVYKRQDTGSAHARAKFHVCQ